MCKRVAVTVAQPPIRVAGASIVTVRFKNGRSIAREVEEFDGTPLARRTASNCVTSSCLQNLENDADIRWLGAY